MKIKTKVMLATTLLLALSCSAQAETLEEKRKRLGLSSEDKAVTLEVGCGVKDKTNCAVILPMISIKTKNSGVILDPQEGEGSTDTTKAICERLIPAGIVQKDVVQMVVKRAIDCPVGIVRIGNPLYPYVGYLITRDKSDPRSLSELVKSAKGDKFIKIAAGGANSGGVATLTQILENNPLYKQKIQIEDIEDKEAMLRRLRGGDIDAIFIMDALSSDSVNKITQEVDNNNKKNFKIINVDLPSSMYRKVKSWDNRTLYKEMTISIPGWGNDVVTISTDAIFIMSDEAEKKNKQAATIIDKAINFSEAGLRSATHTPSSWNYND